MQLFRSGSPRKRSLGSNRHNLKKPCAQTGQCDLSINATNKTNARLVTGGFQQERLPSAMSARTHRTCSQYPGGMCTTINLSQMSTSRRQPTQPPTSNKCAITLELDIPERFRPLLKPKSHTSRMLTRERQRQSYNLHQTFREPFLHSFQSTIVPNNRLNGMVEYSTNYGEHVLESYSPERKSEPSPKKRLVRPMLASILRERMKKQNRQKMLREQKQQLSNERKLYLTKFLQLL